MSVLLAPALASTVVPMPDERFGGLGPVQVVGLVLCVVIPLIGWALLARQVGRFVSLYRLGQPDAGRTDAPLTRTWVLTKEFLGHTRMSRLKVVAVAHWFTALSFIILFATLVNAFFQLVQPDYRLPLIGFFPPFEWLIEVFAWGGFIGIVVLVAIRQKNHPRSAAGVGGRRSRFFGSTFWQAYYVEATIFLVTTCILLLRGLEAAIVGRLEPESSVALHFPLTGWMAGFFSSTSLPALANWVYVVATVKILISFSWMITIALQPTMGVAWHRFLAFPNIWFKREASGATALGAARPLTIGGKPLDMEAMEELEEGDTLGVGAVEDFTWKGLLDFSTCTECGRCQSQCPAWNTEKPLSPKLLIMALRDHADAKAPFLRALGDHDGDAEKAMATVAARTASPDGTHGLEGDAVEGSRVSWPDLPLVGDTGYDLAAPLTAYNPHGPDAVIDQDVLWSCTTCGACVEQCPVDIEHVDHIIDMRRYQTLIESAFPSELGGLFKNLEGKGNPWGMGARARLDWAKDLPFPVRVLGQDVEKASDVEWLFWVGCAGAYEDRAKKTTRAVAELLDTAGVSFAVLGDGETCTGDSARRAGNELLFQTLAAQNVSTFGEFGVTKVVVTCAHCFNTIKNEYPQVGGSYEVVHHTQLLNRLVRDKRLVPVALPSRRAGDVVGEERGIHRRDGDLPRPVLPRPAQRRLRPAARADRRAAGRRAARDGAHPREVVLLRRRRSPDVDGGEARHADQHQPHRGGHRHRGRADRHRLPVLPGDDLRRAHREAGRGRGRGGRGRRRRADAAGGGAPWCSRARARSPTPMTAMAGMPSVLGPEVTAPAAVATPRWLPRRQPPRRVPRRGRAGGGPVGRAGRTGWSRPLPRPRPRHPSRSRPVGRAAQHAGHASASCAATQAVSEADPWDEPAARRRMLHQRARRPQRREVDADGRSRPVGRACRVGRRSQRAARRAKADAAAPWTTSTRGTSPPHPHRAAAASRHEPAAAPTASDVADPWDEPDPSDQPAADEDTTAGRSEGEPVAGEGEG